MNKKFKNGIMTLSLIAILTVFLFLIIIFDNKKYDETCSNPPNEFWIEEELEMVFLTTDIYVLDIDNLGDGLLVVKVEIYDEGAERIYRCLYKVKRRWIGDFIWEMDRYV